MIIGEVQFPGMYPIIQGETTLKAVITQAGGFTPYANLKEAEIIRIMEKELSDPDIEWMKRIPIENMTRMEYEYYKSNIREKTELVVDFDALFNGGDCTQDITLCHQDVINIPYQTRTVRVQGQVARPGLVEWMPDKNYLYYIEQAGSFVYNAKKGKIRVIRADSGKWLKPSRSLRINIGDTIFVPEKPEVNNWVVFKDALLEISQLVTIYVLVKTL
jgi:protein involved in polysaccharide export with SLBB domain